MKEIKFNFKSTNIFDVGGEESKKTRNIEKVGY